MNERLDPRRVVAEGYDRLGGEYARWSRENVRDDARPRYLARLIEALPQGAEVLDLGCGGGGDTTAALAERFALTGVDIPARQIEAARAAVPSATFILGDMTRLDFPARRFDAVVAFHAFTHLPYGELPALMTRIASWLRAGGFLVATMSTTHSEGAIEECLGVPMHFSGYSVDENERLVREAGLALLTSQVETNIEDGEAVPFLWVVARTRGG